VLKGHYHRSACASYSIQAEFFKFEVPKSKWRGNGGSHGGKRRISVENEYFIPPKEHKKSGQMF